MRILVLSDTHRKATDDRPLPGPALNELATADVVLHAGDVTSRALLDELGHYAPVHAVLGNNDDATLADLPERLELDLDGLRVAMVHDSGARAGREGRMRRWFPDADVVVFGHSHEPIDAEGEDGQRLFNPGSPTQRRRQPSPASASWRSSTNASPATRSCDSEGVMDVEELLGLGAATLGEAGGQPMDGTIRPVWPGARLAGPAFTADCAPGDNLAIHVAVAHAPHGSVLVADASAVPDRGYWGEVLTTGAQARGIVGLVIDGCVRDVAALEVHGFGVFSTGISLPGATKKEDCEIGGSVMVGGVTVEAGDWIVGDADGVVVIRADELGAVVDAGRARAEAEQELFAHLRSGATTVDLLGLDESKVRRPD